MYKKTRYSSKPRTRAIRPTPDPPSIALSLPITPTATIRAGQLSFAVPMGPANLTVQSDGTALSNERLVAGAVYRLFDSIAEHPAEWGIGFLIVGGILILAAR